MLHRNRAPYEDAQAIFLLVKWLKYIWSEQKIRKSQFFHHSFIPTKQLHWWRYILAQMMAQTLTVEVDRPLWEPDQGDPSCHWPPQWPPASLLAPPDPLLSLLMLGGVGDAQQQTSQLGWGTNAWLRTLPLLDWFFFVFVKHYDPTFIMGNIKQTWRTWHSRRNVRCSVKRSSQNKD